jgi:hypothetical protein
MFFSCNHTIDAEVVCQYYDRSQIRITASRSPEFEDAWRAKPPRLPDATYLIVSADIGAVRGTSMTVSPSQPTTFTLYTRNAFGKTAATVNITVQ